VRFSFGAIAPWLAGKLAEWYSPHIPFYVGAGAVCVSILVLFSGRALIRVVDRPVTPEDVVEGEATA
jgi:hypothetical protein